jgi:hypothetical protein
LFEELLLSSLIREVAIDAHRERALLLRPESSSPAPPRLAASSLRPPPTEATNADRFPCDHCGVAVTASRYAPHLEKCLGMGRSRGAKRSRGSSIFSGKELFKDPTVAAATQAYLDSIGVAAIIRPRGASAGAVEKSMPLFWDDPEDDPPEDQEGEIKPKKRGRKRLASVE